MTGVRSKRHRSSHATVLRADSPISHASIPLTRTAFPVPLGPVLVPVSVHTKNAALPHTLEQVGNQFAVTRDRIRQIEAKAGQGACEVSSKTETGLACCSINQSRGQNSSQLPRAGWLIRTAVQRKHLTE